MTDSRALARNTALNFAGQIVPLLAALVAIPVLLRHLGAARFGVLTLAWAAIGYFSLFDFGLARALTQAVAVKLAARDATAAEELPAMAWTALWLMLGLGTIGGLLLAALSPLIVTDWLRIPEALSHESRSAFNLLAFAIPWVVMTAGFRGLMEAHQDFAAATALRIPLAAFTFLGPLVVLPFSSSLVAILAVLVVGRALTLAAHVVVCMRRYAYLRRGVAARGEIVVPLLRNGGWMTVSNVVSPVMAYLDRFFIAAIMPLAAVAQYVTPYEIVTKLLLLPQALIGVLFPAFASTYAWDRDRTALLFERAMRATLLLIFLPLLIVVLFAREGLTMWVGADFARAGAPVLQWLAVGVLLNGLAQPPFAMLQSTGRADLTAKLHLVELPLYVAGLWWLAREAGITGVAIAWTLRVALDAVVLLVLSLRIVPGALRQLERVGVGTLLALAALAMASLMDGSARKAGFLAAAATGFLALGWTYAIRPGERASLRSWTRPRVAPPA